MRRKNEHPNKIRNGRIRRDFKRLLEIIANANDLVGAETLSEVERIAENNALYFDDNGELREMEVED